MTSGGSNNSQDRRPDREEIEEQQPSQESLQDHHKSDKLKTDIAMNGETRRKIVESMGDESKKKYYILYLYLINFYSLFKLLFQGG